MKKVEYIGLKNKRKIYLFVGFLIVLFASIGIYYFVYYPKQCKDFSSYQDALLKCKRIVYINEDETSVWRYTVQGTLDKDFCKIEVRLLKIKKGQITIESLQDKTMVCKVLKSGNDFPEKDMTHCSGPLKEELQEIIIERIHNYLLQNLGVIQENLKAI